MTSSSDSVSSSYVEYVPPERNRFLAFAKDFARTKPLGAVSAVVVILVVLVAIFADVIAPYPPFENHTRDALRGPSADYWFGTDNFGRDTFSRVIHGARVSLVVGFTASALVVIISLTLGITSAYFGGLWDYLVGRVIDVVQAIPFLVLLLPMTIIFGRGMFSIAFVLGLLIGIIATRVIRGAALGVAAQPYILVAQSIGAAPPRIILRYMIPNILPIVIILASINIGSIIIAEASLSFLGYGVNPTESVTWGAMLSSDGRRFMVDQPWLFIAPAGAIGVVLYAFNMFGDALRDKLDPRLRGTS